MRAADAVLGKSGLKPLPLPPAAGRDVAYADLQDARRAAAHLDAAYSLADTVETARRPNADVAAAQHAADQVLAQAGGKVPEGRSPLAARWYGSQHALRTAQDKAVLPNAWVDRSAARLQQVEADQALDHANQAVAQARPPAALAQAQRLGWGGRSGGRKAAAALEGGADAQVHAADNRAPRGQGRRHDAGACGQQAGGGAAGRPGDGRPAGSPARRRGRTREQGGATGAWLRQRSGRWTRRSGCASGCSMRMDLDGFQRGLPANLKAPRTEDDKPRSSKPRSRTSWNGTASATAASAPAPTAWPRSRPTPATRRTTCSSAAGCSRPQTGSAAWMGHTRSEYEHFLQTGGRAGQRGACGSSKPSTPGRQAAGRADTTGACAR